MIGLEIFRRFFAAHSDAYTLIGGAACTLLMEEAGLEFRATKDLDIVLHIEAIDNQFFSTFSQFLKDGGYQNGERSNGKEIFFRFDKPTQPQFPALIEIFTRSTEEAKLDFKGHIRRIEMSDTAICLSAILLNDDYYKFIHQGKISIQEISVVSASHLIPLKARAWSDFLDRKKQGFQSDSKDIRKHKNDILRLYRLLSPENRIVLPNAIKKDMLCFVDHLREDPYVEIKQLGLKTTKLDTILDNLCSIYDLR